ncbi:hypothetical protein DZF79_14895 [Vibrio parahaemolyticus]|nr:hypothetical protein [Vibrio parahaemolyticus]
MEIMKPMRYVNGWQLRKYIQENYSKDVKEMNGEELLENLFGSFRESGEFRIEDIHYIPEQTWWHRLNRLWAYPLTIICSPYRYVRYGHIGWDDKTNFGRWLIKVTGH